MANKQLLEAWNAYYRLFVRLLYVCSARLSQATAININHIIAVLLYLSRSKLEAATTKLGVVFLYLRLALLYCRVKQEDKRRQRERSDDVGRRVTKLSDHAEGVRARATQKKS